MGEAIVIARDLLMRARLEDAAAAAGYDVSTHTMPPPPTDRAPALLVVDLDAGVTEQLTPWRETHPGLRIVGFLSHIDEEGRARAEALEIEVHPRGRSTAAVEVLRG